MSDTIAGIVEDIERLYSSANPAEIASIQSRLQEIQKSSEGHQLARLLMSMDAKVCQFFGALTYSVIINTRKHLDKQSLELALVEMFGFIVSLLRSDDFSSSLFILRKLIYNIALLFVDNYKEFDDPIERFLTAVGLQPDLKIVVNSLEPRALSVILSIGTAVVEELMKREQGSEIHQAVYAKVYGNLLVIYEYFAEVNAPSDIDIQLLDCLSSWINYISLAESQSTIRYQNTQPILTFLFNHFRSTQFDDTTLEAANKAITATAEILETNPHMLTREHKNCLQSILFEQGKWGQAYIDNVVLNDTISEEEDTANYVNLLLAFLANDIVSFSKNLAAPTNVYIIDLVLRLTDFPGSAIVDEKVSDQLLAFWEELANIFIDDEETYDQIFADVDQSIKTNFFTKRDEAFHKVCSIYWNKVKIPTDGFQSNRAEFLYFRSNVGDFFCTMYSLLKLPFYDNLTQAAAGQIADITTGTDKLLELESTLFILQKINDDCTFYESQSSILLPYIDELLEKNLLVVLATIDKSNPQYSVIYSTIINYIASIEFYLKTAKGSYHLNAIFNMLFGVILGDNTKLSLVASKTILSVCHECRNSLKSFLPDLESLLDQMIQSQKIDNLIRQRMSNAYISIAQSIPNPNDLAIIIMRLLTVIEQAAAEVMAREANAEEEDYLVSLLICVSEIGKACSIPDEVGNFYTEDQSTTIDQYWKRDENGLKAKLLSIVQQFSLNYPPLINNTTVTETCCQILKAGVNEPIDGPFKFSLQTIFEYMVVKIYKCNAPSVTHIFRLFETVVITNYASLDDKTIEEVISRLFTDRLNFLHTDPDMIQSSIELFATILEKRPSLIVKLDVFRDVVINFALNGLKAAETLIIKSTAKFWISLLSMKRGNKEDQEQIKHLMINNGLGMLLCHQLVISFINSTRSSLDYYYPIFRNLISKYSISLKIWLPPALASMQHLSTNDKELFIQKLLITRGQRPANDILKKFWLQVNGLVDYSSQTF